IVGAGTAGCVLAARLSEDRQRRVLVLEAGPDMPAGPARPVALRDSYSLPVGEWDWGIRALCDGRREINLPVGKVVGGTSLIGGAGAWRPRASDFDAWAADGLPQWSWDRVAPLFNAVEDDAEFGDRPWHGSAGPLPVTRFTPEQLVPSMRSFVAAVTDAGHPYCEDLNAPDATGIGPNPLAKRGRERVSAADAYLTSEVRGRQNLELRTGATVQRVVLKGGRVVGVVCDGELVRAEETIVCAGVPFSPALLLRSGIGPATELEAAGVTPLADLEGVGRGVMDQPAVILFAIPAGNGDAGSHAAAGPGGHEPFLQVAARLPSFPGEVEDHAFYMCLFNRMPVDEAMKPLVRAQRAHWLIVSDLAPASRGAITLGGPGLEPVCDLRFYDEASDFRRMRAGLLALWELTKHPALAEQIDRIALVTDKMIDNETRLESIIRGRAVSRQPWGGCAMGPAGRADAVVDAAGRVHGIEGLRVADTSVVPVPLRAGGTLTALVIGERIATAVRAADVQAPPAAAVHHG
ncbi:MAG: GMC family oxidoreductase, partial [Solirubrobacteraceae bacterium]